MLQALRFGNSKEACLKAVDIGFELSPKPDNAVYKGALKTLQMVGRLAGRCTLTKTNKKHGTHGTCVIMVLGFTRLRFLIPLLRAGSRLITSTRRTTTRRTLLSRQKCSFVNLTPSGLPPHRQSPCIHCLDKSIYQQG